MRTVRTAALCLIVAASGLEAQSEIGRAALRGTVTDPSGKSIESAVVTIRETQTGLQRTVKTNAEGGYRAGALPVGTYSAMAAAPGFSTGTVENIALTVGDTRTVNLTLPVA